MSRRDSPVPPSESDTLSELSLARSDSGDELPDADDEPEPIPAGLQPKGDQRSDTVLLLPSLFKGLPATIWFEYPTFLRLTRDEARDCTVDLSDKRLLPLLFKSDRTINCILNVCKRSGFKRLLKGQSFNLYWGHHLNEKAMRNLGPSQVVNHFPGSYGIGRKDHLWKNVSRMQRQHQAAYDFCAKSYLLPRDRLEELRPAVLALLNGWRAKRRQCLGMRSRKACRDHLWGGEAFERDFEEGEVYIVKPPAGAEGRGIRLINKIDQLPRGSVQMLVQRYLGEPHLVNHKKYDLRIYVAVTSFDPLRIYTFKEGLARFATSDYVETHSNKSIKDRYMHLTNYSVNKKSKEFVKNTDASRDDEGSKWSLTALFKHLQGHGVDVSALQARIDDLMIKTIIAVEHSVVSKCNAMCYNRAKCFELFGFDVLLDRQLKPWLIEVNVACSLASSSPLDKTVKNTLMSDLFHLIGIIPFDRKGQQEEIEERKRSRLLHGNSVGIKRRNIFDLQNVPLSELSLEDLEVIMVSEDELRRRGHWRRLLPCKDMITRYLPLFEFPRYRNLILAKWMEQPDWSLLLPHLSSATVAMGAKGSASANDAESSSPSVRLQAAPSAGLPLALRQAMLSADRRRRSVAPPPLRAGISSPKTSRRSPSPQVRKSMTASSGFRRTPQSPSFAVPKLRDSYLPLQRGASPFSPSAPSRQGHARLSPSLLLDNFMQGAAHESFDATQEAAAAALAKLSIRRPEVDL